MNTLLSKSILLCLILAGLGIGALMVPPTEPSTIPPPVSIGSTGALTKTVSHPEKQDEFTEFVLPFLKEHCLSCHTGDESEGDLDLSEFETLQTVIDDMETWESITDAVDDGFMPPEEKPSPSSKQVKQLTKWFSELLDDNGQSKPVSHIRRLNRVEYENTIRDLLRMNHDVFSNPNRLLLADHYFQPASGKMPRHIMALSHFLYEQKRPPALPSVTNVPSDPPVEHGFSNDQSGLSFSPLQLERYMELAYSIVTDANLQQLSDLWESLFDPSPLPTDPEEQKQLAEQRLTPFIERAFRREVSPVEIQRYVSLFDHSLEQKGNYRDAIRETVVAVLVSPSFLFRRDFADSSLVDGRVVPFDMASRLSYFLWGSIPDAALLAAAKERRLQTRQELLTQVRRMMKDKRIKSLATDFGMQWLKVSKVASVRPDIDLFPLYYKNQDSPPGISMMIEQLLLFETIMVEDRSIREFIHTDIAYLNRQLMDWYHMKPEDVLGFTPPADSYEDFFRITWPNIHRGGVIASGATLVGTSATTRTSPVYRGAWIMDVIFNRPPPSPPADVPALEDDNHKGVLNLNIRAKLKQHREDPNCAVCHDRIDPYGFALENFDAVGQWRREYGDGVKVDTKGKIFDEDYEGAARFKAVLLRHEDEFVRGFVEHMLRYALGRQLEITDTAAIDKIVERVKERELKFSAVVEEIVLSDLFQSK